MLVRSNTSWILSLGTKDKAVPAAPERRAFFSVRRHQVKPPSYDLLAICSATPGRVNRAISGAFTGRLLAFAALELGAALAAGLLADELDAPVLAPAALVVFLADWPGLAVAVAPELARKHVALLERAAHGGGAPL